MPVNTSPMRIAIVDDHAIVRIGYRRLLEDEPGIQVVAEYGDADAAWEGLDQLSPDQVHLLILDLSMPGRSGLDLLRQLRQYRPDLTVVVFTMHDTAALRTQCLRAGAAAFVGKGSDPECLLAAVRDAAVRRPDAAPPTLQRARPLSTGTARAPHEDLTPRELEALMLLLQGVPLEQVATRMGVSDKTVSNYQTTIRQKLGVSNAIELIRYGQAHALVP